MHGVARLQLHAVPRLHHQQQHRRRRVVVVADGGVLPVPVGIGERQHGLRVPPPDRQRAARRADQPDARRHAAQGLQLHGRPASMQRCVGPAPSSSSGPRRGLGLSRHATAAPGGAGAAVGNHRVDATDEEPEPGADEAAGGAQLCLERQCSCACVRGDPRTWSHAGLRLGKNSTLLQDVFIIMCFLGLFVSRRVYIGSLYVYTFFWL